MQGVQQVEIRGGIYLCHRERDFLAGTFLRDRRRADPGIQRNQQIPFEALSQDGFVCNLHATKKE